MSNDRNNIWPELDSLQRSLRGVSAECMQWAPPHVRDMPGEGPHVAWVYACCEAMKWPDPYLVTDLCCGAPTCGVVPDSGVLRAKDRPATAALSACGHNEYTERLMRRVEPTTPEAHEQSVALWTRTMEEVMPAPIVGVPPAHQGSAKLPWTRGPFTKEELDERFSSGCWRPLQRFGVTQGGKLRPCDNGASSGHNDASAFQETIACETADFPARLARLFSGAPLMPSTCRVALTIWKRPTEGWL